MPLINNSRPNDMLRSPDPTSHKRSVFRQFFDVKAVSHVMLALSTYVIGAGLKDPSMIAFGVGAVASVGLGVFFHWVIAKFMSNQ